MSETLFHGNLVTTQRILYTPSDFAKTSLIHLQEVGQLHAQRPHISKRENLSSYLFFIVVSGSGTLQYNNVLHTLDSGDCVFIDCHKPYYHKSSSNLWILQWVHFNGPEVASIYNKYVERGGQPCLHPTDLEHYKAILKKVYITASSEDYVRDMRINEYLACLLTLLMKDSWYPGTKQKNAQKQNLINVKTFLNEHFSEKITLDKLSELFFINKFYLTRIFKEQFGVSINNYLQQIRITHAKQLLRFTDRSVESIGMECGIGELYYFSRVFKKIEGIGPREYRKLW